MPSNRNTSEKREVRSEKSDKNSLRCLSVIIPLHNEAATIVQLLKRVVAQPQVGQLIIVDDCSADNSLQQVRAFVKTISRSIDTHVIHLERNNGKGAAVTRGFALVNQPYVVIQDADLEYDPADYAGLLKPLIAGQARVVFGSRFLRPPVKKDGRIPLHDAGNRFLSWYISWLFHIKLTDLNTCYKCFDSRLLQKINCTEKRFSWDPQLTAQLITLGETIVEVPIWYNARTVAEGKKIRWQDGFSQLWVLFKERLKHPAVYGQLMLTIIASALLVAGLLLQKTATIQRMNSQPITFLKTLKSGPVIELPANSICQTGPGLLVSGPYIILPPGRYRYQAKLSSPGEISAIFDAISGQLDRTYERIGVGGSQSATIDHEIRLRSWAFATEFRIANGSSNELCVQDQQLIRLSLDVPRLIISALTPVHDGPSVQ